MAQQTINIGSAPDDGTGDTIRVGGDKINDNFTELYAADAALGTAAALDVDVDDTLAADSDSLIPTQQAVKAYVDNAVAGAGSVSDTAYGVGWDGDTTTAPSKNAVYDKIESLGGGSFTAASTTEVLTGTDTTKGVTPDALAALWEQGSDVASAGTTSLGEGGYFNITGTTTITDIDFATDKAGRHAWVKFAGALTLTHNASTLILPTGANITTAAGDTACFVSEGTDAVRCVAYTRASGAALSGGSSPAIALISEVITSGSQASVTFATISGSYRDLILVVRGRGTTAALSTNVFVQFNNDTGSNYHYEDAHWFSATGAAAQSVSQTSCWVGTLPAASATASYAGSVRAEIMAYDDTTFFKNLLSDYGAHLGTTATTQGRGIISGLWISTSAITEIDVILSAGAFVDGSIVSLYGRT